MTAVVPLWIIWVVLGVSVFVCAVGCFAWGQYKEKKAHGKWPFIKPVFDVRFLPNNGELKVYYIETFNNNDWAIPHGQGRQRIKVYENTGMFGWFGGKERTIDVDDYVEVGGIIFQGKAEFEHLFNLRVGVLKKDIEHYRLEAERWQGLAEQRRHDPQAGIELGIENIATLAKAVGPAIPRPANTKPGVKR